MQKIKDSVKYNNNLSPYLDADFQLNLSNVDG